MTPIFIIDGNQLFCEGLTYFLDDSPFKIVSQTADLREFNRLARRVDDGAILLLDYPGSFADPHNELKELREHYPAARLVVLSSNDEQTEFFECVSAGIDGYLLKNISSLVLIESLRLIALGEKVFPSVLASWLLDSRVEKRPTQSIKGAADAELSKREIEILECLVDGASNKAIARRLSISDATVKVHVKNVLRKIAVENRTQAAIWALTMGVVGDGRFRVDVDGTSSSVVVDAPKNDAKASAVKADAD